MIVLLSLKAAETVSGEEIKKFLGRHLTNGRQVCTDALPVMNVVEERGLYPDCHPLLYYSQCIVGGKHSKFTGY